MIFTPSTLTELRVQAALAAVGTPYVYGAGSPRDARPGDLARLARGVAVPASNGVRGWDCSGHVQAYAVTVGDLDPAAVDRGAHGLAMEALDAITVEEALLGDIVVDDADSDGRVEHVRLYLGGGMTFSMSGGSRATFGDNPSACGQIVPLRRCLTLARWKPSVRPPK